MEHGEKYSPFHVEAELAIAQQRVDDRPGASPRSWALSTLADSAKRGARAQQALQLTIALEPI